MKNKLRELRKNQKLTQEELANLIGISRQAINAIEKEKFDLFLSGYQSLRKLDGLEFESLANFLRLSALRFWVSRLDAYYNILEGENILIKNPDYFKKVLLDRQGV